jgi:tetratricopeptide (TPR) repeat protein
MILDQDPALAREILENMSRGDVVARSRLRLVQHHQLNAKALLGAGFPALARETAEKATRIAFEAGMDGEAVYSGVLLARILAELGLYNKSLTALNDAGNLLAKLGKVHLAEEVWWLTAVSYHYIGDIPHAENALEKARAEVDRKKTLINEDRFVTRYEKHPIVQAIQAGLGERNKPAYL